ncbi:putative ArsR family transcriptional regulator [Azospirillaceae bacterium]
MIDILKVFGSLNPKNRSGKVKVINYFLKISEPTVMWDISKATHTSYSLLKNFIIPELLSQGIIVLHRKIGSNKFYKTNLKSPIVKQLMKLI